MPLMRQLLDEIVRVKTQRTRRSAVKAPIALTISVETARRDDGFLDRELRDAAA